MINKVNIYQLGEKLIYKDWNNKGIISEGIITGYKREYNDQYGISKYFYILDNGHNIEFGFEE